MRSSILSLVLLGLASTSSGCAAGSITGAGGAGGGSVHGASTGHPCADGGCAGGAPVCGGSPCGLTTLVTGAAAAQMNAIALDATDVYFGYSEPDANDMWVKSIARVPRAGGAMTQVFQLAVPAGSGFNVWSLLQDADHLYFSSYEDGIYTVPKAGGMPSELASDPAAGALAGIDASHVYYEAAGGLQRVLKTGGTAELTTPFTQPAGFLVDGQTVYWIECGGDIYSAPLAGGTPTTLGVPDYTDGPGCPGFMAVDAEHLYFVGPELTNAIGGVFRVPKTGGKVLKLQPGVTSVPIDLALDGPTVFWSEDHNQDTDLSGSVFAASLTGGAPEMIANGLEHPYGGMVAEPGAVYWLNARGYGGIGPSLMVYRSPSQ